MKLNTKGKVGWDIAFLAICLQKNPTTWETDYAVNEVEIPPETTFFPCPKSKIVKTSASGGSIDISLIPILSVRYVAKAPSAHFGDASAMMPGINAKDIVHTSPQRTKLLNIKLSIMIRPYRIPYTIPILQRKSPD